LIHIAIPKEAVTLGKEKSEAQKEKSQRGGGDRKIIEEEKTGKHSPEKFADVARGGTRKTLKKNRRWRCLKKSKKRDTGKKGSDLLGRKRFHGKRLTREKKDLKEKERKEANDGTFQDPE